MRDVPVVFIVFNRPDFTERVFAAIREARPRTLIVVADGPRESRPGEAERCKAVRAILEQVDWPCELVRDFSENNLGCRMRVATGISAAFEKVERAIILEDDCLPHLSFFRYCQEMLDRYERDPRVMHVGGSNFQEGKWRGEASYFFSRFIHVWGWATWRRAWEHYDLGMIGYPEFRDLGGLAQWGQSRLEQWYWRKVFDEVHAGGVDTWDYQWVYSCWAKQGLSVYPNVNMISNIGFGADATHTTEPSPLMNKPGEEIGEIRHPEVVAPNLEADAFSFNHAFGGEALAKQRTLHRRMYNRIRIVGQKIAKACAPQR